jgi:hypothetical protein
MEPDRILRISQDRHPKTGRGTETSEGKLNMQVQYGEQTKILRIITNNINLQVQPSTQQMSINLTQTISFDP